MERLRANFLWLKEKNKKDKLDVTYLMFISLLIRILQFYTDKIQNQAKPNQHLLTSSKLEED